MAVSEIDVIAVLLTIKTDPAYYAAVELDGLLERAIRDGERISQVPTVLFTEV